jgi:hypothetical protein
LNCGVKLKLACRLKYLIVKIGSGSGENALMIFSGDNVFT